MYVTIIAVRGWCVAYGPHPAAEPAVTVLSPSAAAGAGIQPFTARLNPPELLDPLTGVITDPRVVVNLDQAAAETLIALDGTEASAHTAPVIAVIVHPATHNAVVVGPFDPATAAQWWEFWRHRFPLSGTHMTVLTLAHPRDDHDHRTASLWDGGEAP